MDKWSCKSQVKKRVKEAKGHELWKIAKETLKVCSPVLGSSPEAFISEVKDATFFILMKFDERMRCIASVIEVEEDGEDYGASEPLVICKGTEATDMIAAFLINYPDAVFSLAGGAPLHINFKDINMCRYVTLNNFKMGLDKKNRNCDLFIPKLQDE